MGLLGPVDVAAERVVERGAVFEDKRAAGGGGAEAAERDALAGGVGDAGGCAAVELEAGVLAEGFVEGDGRVVVENLGREAEDGLGGFAEGRGGAGGGDGDLVCQPASDRGWSLRWRCGLGAGCDAGEEDDEGKSAAQGILLWLAI